MVGLIFDKTEILRSAFDVAKPKATATLEGAHKSTLNGTPTHLRFTGDEQSLIVAIPGQDVLVLDCNRLRQRVRLFIDTLI
jgi:hypothetical protein